MEKKKKKKKRTRLLYNLANRSVICPFIPPDDCCWKLLRTAQINFRVCGEPLTKTDFANVV